jgi:transmembrane sensor
MNNSFSRSVDWAVLARYLSGESEPAEAEAVGRWIDSSPDRRAMVEGLRQVWANAAMPRQEWDTEAAIRRVLDEAPVVRLASRRGGRRWLGWAAVAAAAIVLLAIGLTQWRPAFVRSLPTALLGMREYATPRGQYATLALADGTRITLAPLSRLRVPRNLDGVTRQVYLEGQALFKVPHDTARAFHVYTARAVATDLGTTFVVRAYADAPGDEVVVTEGLVSLSPQSSSRIVSAGAEPLTLRPGDLGRVGSGGGLSIEHGVSTEEYTAWAEGRLVFRRTPLRDVASELARWYDLDIRIPDSVTAARRVTASFDGQPASEILRYVALSLGLDYEGEGRIIVLTPKAESGKSAP